MAASIEHISGDENMACNDNKPFPSFIERYFTARYKTDMKRQPCEDFCILQHSNKICVITIGRGHPILRDKLEIEKVDFQVNASTNRMENKVIGKSKKGAQNLHEDSALCKVHCSNGRCYTLYSCVRGKLVEVNESLAVHPELLSQRPNTEGYLAIILLRLSDCDAQLEKLISEKQYSELLESRATLVSDSSHGDGLNSTLSSKTEDLPT